MKMNKYKFEDQFHQSITESGIKPPENFAADGENHRFSTNNKAGDKAGWYVLKDEKMIIKMSELNLSKNPPYIFPI